jgi:hypothetical protein
MDGIQWIILASLAVPVIWAVSSALSSSRTQNKFASMGVLQGKTKDEIIQEVGLPSSFSSIGEGKELLQWQQPGYHIALLFTNGVCDGVSHEHAA